MTDFRRKGDLMKNALRCGMAAILDAPPRRGKLLMLLALALPLGSPAPAHAIGILELVVAGVTATAGFYSGTATLMTLFGGQGINNDNPLYSSGSTSPTLTISASETNFNLFIDQPLEISEFQDDDPATLRGVMGFNDGQGFIPAWDFSLTFTAAINPVSANTLKVSGFVQHIRKPSGPEHINDGQTGPGLDPDVTATQPFPWFPATHLIVTTGDSQTHSGGFHKDILQESKLDVLCCETISMNFLEFDYRMKGVHTPEPSTFLLLAGGLLGLAQVGRRKQR